MCSFLIRPTLSSVASFEYFAYPECKHTSNEDFVLHYFLSTGSIIDTFTIRYTDGVSIIDDTFSISPIQPCPDLKAIFQPKYKVDRINREMRPIPFLEEC